MSLIKEPSHTKTDAREKVIMLVDDDEDEHEIFLSALKNISDDIIFISAVSCEHALKILSSAIPDIIFLDVNMPKVNGIICLQEIRKIKTVSHVPVYMYSTGINTKEGQKAILLGAEDYIIKPNSISSLTSILKEIVK